jgi:hypothetical protein
MLYGGWYYCTLLVMIYSSTVIQIPGSYHPSTRLEPNFHL